jgi:hypothetical protein
MDEKTPPVPSGSVLLDVRPPASATVFGKVAQCSRCHASPLSAQEIQGGWLCQACATGAGEQMEQQRLGGSFAATPCQVMFGWAPGSPTERPCGATPTVGGNGLYRYCEHHMRMAAKAGATTLQRDANADLQIDDNGDLVASPVDLASEFANYRDRPDDIPHPVMLPTTGTVTYTLAEVAEAQRAGAVIRCAPIAWPGEWFTAGGSYVVGDVVSTPTGKLRCAATGTSPRETPSESLAKIKRDIAVGLLDDKAARAALSRMIYIQHDLKHGPGGTGRDGPCDAGCVKCAAEEEIKRIGTAPKARSGVSGRHAERFFVDDPHGPPIVKAAREVSPELRAQLEQIQRCEHRPLLLDASAAPPLRPDGFSQAQVDAAKAVLLTPVVKRGGR